MCGLSLCQQPVSPHRPLFSLPGISAPLAAPVRVKTAAVVYLDSPTTSVSAPRATRDDTATKVSSQLQPVSGCRLLVAQTQLRDTHQCSERTSTEQCCLQEVKTKLNALNVEQRSTPAYVFWAGIFASSFRQHVNT